MIQPTLIDCGEVREAPKVPPEPLGPFWMVMGYKGEYWGWFFKCQGYGNKGKPECYSDRIRAEEAAADGMRHGWTGALVIGPVEWKP